MGTETGVPNALQHAAFVVLLPGRCRAEQYGAFIAIEPVVRHIVQTPAAPAPCWTYHVPQSAEILLDPVNLLNMENEPAVLAKTIELGKR